MAVYRPIGLAPVGTSTLQPGRVTTYADRRRAAAERIRLAETLVARLAAAVERQQESARGAQPIDPDGALGASVRALVPVVHRDAGCDLLISRGPDHGWAVRLHHGPSGLQAELVPGPGAPSAAASPPESQVVAELAAWLRAGAVKAW